jgi:uncharacterized protein (UPF0276 family)
MQHNRPLAGVALGWRPELAADLLRDPEGVDFLEVVADTCFTQPSAWREARALAELRPVVPHGVKLSLGSADGVDLARARKLGALARELGAPALSEHVAMTRGGGREIGHLTALPFTREAVRVVARNVASARRVLPDVPLLLENVAWTFRWPEDEMPEGAFYAEVARATGCELLLDVANLYANALNSGIAPARALRDHPLDRVGMVHVAGGVMEHGFFLDTHAHPVPEEVFGLLEGLLRETGPLPIVLERDHGFPPFAELAQEVDRLRALLAAAPSRPPVTRRMPEDAEANPSREGAMGDRQRVVAHMLTDVEPPPASLAGPFGLEAIARTRAVLRHKRVDDALPFLPRTAAAGDPARALALDVLTGAPRAPRAAGIADALRIADAAAAAPGLASGARRDRLELRARFAARGGEGAWAPRPGPFVGRERLPEGRSVWAVKGFGLEAPVRVIERGGAR